MGYLGASRSRPRGVGQGKSVPRLFKEKKHSSQNRRKQDSGQILLGFFGFCRILEALGEF